MELSLIHIFCAQNLGTEGLGDIVVGAQREAVHEIIVLVAAADDDDRRGDAVAPDSQLRHRTACRKASG